MMLLRALVSAAALLCLAAASQAEPLALAGATLVDGTGTGPVADAVVIVQGQRIACAGTREACPIEADTRVVHLEGRFITPGLVDAHVHYSQTGWADGRPDSLDVRDRYPYAEVIASLKRDPGRWHRSYLCSGVTGVFDVGGYPWTWNIARAARDVPHYAAAGPLLSTVEHWVNLPAEKQFIYLEDVAAVTDAVDYVRVNGSDAVKLWFIPSRRRGFDTLRELAMKAGKAADQAGLPFIVHATGLEVARAAVKAGAEVLVHSVSEDRVDQTFIDAVVRSKVILIPTLTVHEGYYNLYRAALSGEPPAVDDPNGCVDRRTKERVRQSAELGGRLGRGEGWLKAFRRRLDREAETMAHNLRALQRAGAVIATGTDAGNPLTLHGPAIYGEMEAMEAAGLSPMEIIVASTRNAARAMGREDEFGTLEAGKTADLLVLTADPTETVTHFRELIYVMRAGKLTRQETLRATP